MSNVTYGRGQVEHALWTTFRGGSMAALDKPPKVFLTRVKRLLEMDRALDLSDRAAPPAVDFSFVDVPETRGGNVVFAKFDAVCLAVALDLLNAGFKQTEVVFLMRHLRLSLEGALAPIVDARGGEAAGSDFLLIRKIELKDALNSPKLEGHVDPLFLEPIFCSTDDLSDQLAGLMPAQGRVVTVVELASTAKTVCRALDKAPEIRRGRPKA